MRLPLLLQLLPIWLLALSTQAVAAGPGLTIHYSERAPLHSTQQGMLTGDAALPVLTALKAAGIDYAVRSTPAKQQLVILKENRVAACMMSWVDLPGRDQRGKFSAVIYRDSHGERRLWCTKAVPDEVLQRLNAALAPHN
jgi:hypothetical protein